MCKHCYQKRCDRGCQKPCCRPIKCYKPRECYIKRCGGYYKKCDGYGGGCGGCDRCKPPFPTYYCFQQYKKNLIFTVTGLPNTLVCTSVQRLGNQVTINIPYFSLINTVGNTEIKFGPLDCQYRPKVDMVFYYQLTFNGEGTSSNLLITTDGYIAWKSAVGALLFPTGNYIAAATAVTFIACDC